MSLDFIYLLTFIDYVFKTSKVNRYITLLLLFFSLPKINIFPRQCCFGIWGRPRITLNLSFIVAHSLETSASHLFTNSRLQLGRKRIHFSIYCCSFLTTLFDSFSIVSSSGDRFAHFSPNAEAAIVYSTF